LEQRSSDCETLREQLEQSTSEAQAQRKALSSLREQVDRVGAERDRLAETTQHLTQINEQLTTERRHYFDLLLGKISMLQCDHTGLRRAIAELGPLSKSTVRVEIVRDAYLNLLENSLTGFTLEDVSMLPGTQMFDPETREIGRDWPSLALTMIGRARMRNLRNLVETVIADGIPGDLLEAGVWRGGACIYMRAILHANGLTDRRVWVADSFAGLPPPHPEQYPADRDDPHHAYECLAVSLQEVQANFRRYGLLDKQVEFLQGWFKDTLPNAPIEKLSLLRLDGDMYESTIQTLDALYWKVAEDGFVIVDDYILNGCRKAVDDFRLRHGIKAPIEAVDGAAVYWRKAAGERALGKTENSTAATPMGHELAR
jgi:O-methyltransferase/8-demethyl-8-(2,3-dimethoxy-alpha-L-rhamnosyl)tetracenomycin-C 4'-O-methyltransferase